MLPRKIFYIRWECTVESAIFLLSSSCYGRPCYYGQPELTQETRKLIAHEQIEHWPKFSASEGTNSEFISTSESLKNIELPTRTVPMREKCSCRRESVRLHRNE